LPAQARIINRVARRIFDLGQTASVLRDLLKDGPRPFKEVMEAAEMRNISERTIERAADKLGVVKLDLTDAFVVGCHRGLCYTIPTDEGSVGGEKADMLDYGKGAERRLTMSKPQGPALTDRPKAIRIGDQIPDPDFGAYVDIAFNTVEWSIRTIDPNRWTGRFWISYPGSKTHKPCAQYTAMNSYNYIQHFWVHNTHAPPNTYLISLGSHSPQWYAPSVPQASPVVYEIIGYSYPNYDPQPDVGVLVTGYKYQNGLYITMGWDDCGTQEGSSGGPNYSFNDKITAVFLPLIYGQDYQQAKDNISDITIHLS